MAETRVLITGGAGFVGATLVRQLVAAGEDVHLLLRPSTSLWRLAEFTASRERQRPEYERKRPEHTYKRPEYTPHLVDLRDPEAVHGVVAAIRPAVVYHLATHGVYPRQQVRYSILTDNLVAVGNLLDALAEHEYQRFVYTGSAAEYGVSEKPIREDAPLSPSTDYGVAKAAGSMLCQVEARRGRPVVIVRIFTAYGPYEDPNRLVPYVQACCQRGERPQVSAGLQVRDFIHVEDVVGLMRLAAEDPAAIGRVLHAATGQGHTVRDMIQTLMRLGPACGLEAEFGAKPTRAGEPPVAVASIEETTRLTGWRPRFDLEAGAARMWEWFGRSAAKRAA